MFGIINTLGNCFGVDSMKLLPENGRNSKLSTAPSASNPSQKQETEQCDMLLNLVYADDKKKPPAPQNEKHQRFLKRRKERMGLLKGKTTRTKQKLVQSKSSCNWTCDPQQSNQQPSSKKVIFRSDRTNPSGPGNTVNGYLGKNVIFKSDLTQPSGSGKQHSGSHLSGAGNKVNHHSGKKVIFKSDNITISGAGNTAGPLLLNGKEINKLDWPIDPSGTGSADYPKQMISAPRDWNKSDWAMFDVNPSKYVAIDCEMVGAGPCGQISLLARCSIVSHNGDVMFDKFIQPTQPVTDFRTRWSGITPQHLRHALPFEEARKQILSLLKGKVVVGHAIHNDFKALRYFHPATLTRDTQRIPLLNQNAGFQKECVSSLKNLTKAILKNDIQTGRRGHSSVEDAKATMQLYKTVATEWETHLRSATGRQDLYRPAAPGKSGEASDNKVK